MAAAAMSTATLLRPPRVVVGAVVHPSQSPVASATRLHRPRTTTACAAAQTTTTTTTATTQSSGKGGIQRWTSAPVTAISAATEDGSIFLVSVDVSGAAAAAALADAYTTPGQYLMARVPSPPAAAASEKRSRAAYMCISSAPRSGLQLDLLVRSVAGTTSEQLCKLGVGDAVELGPVMGRGFAVQHINPASAAGTMLLFAVGEGISPVRSLIEFGFAATERADVRLYYSAKDLPSMPYQDRFDKWEKTGVKVVPLTQQIEESFLEKNLDEIIVNPLSTGAVIVAPSSVEEVITGVLLDFGVPHDKILTIEWSPKDPFAV